MRPAISSNRSTERVAVVDPAARPRLRVEHEVRPPERGRVPADLVADRVQSCRPLADLGDLVVERGMRTTGRPTSPRGRPRGAASLGPIAPTVIGGRGDWTGRGFMIAASTR